MALKKRCGTATRESPMYSLIGSVTMGPHTMMIALSICAHVRHLSSSFFHVPELRLLACGQMLVSRNDSSMAFSLHFMSAAGAMWPRS